MVVPLLTIVEPSRAECIYAFSCSRTSSVRYDTTEEVVEGFRKRVASVNAIGRLVGVGFGWVWLVEVGLDTQDQSKVHKFLLHCNKRISTIDRVNTF